MDGLESAEMELLGERGDEVVRARRVRRGERVARDARLRKERLRVGFRGGVCGVGGMVKFKRIGDE